MFLDLDTAAACCGRQLIEVYQQQINEKRMPFVQRKRKSKDAFSHAVAKQQKSKKSLQNEEIPSDSEEEAASVNGQHVGEDNEVSDAEAETAQEKRLRLTKQYLADVERAVKEDADASDLEGDAVAHRLHADAMASTGTVHKCVADQYTEAPSCSEFRVLRGHKLSVTCIAVAEDCTLLFSGSKDGAIGKWNLKTFQKLKFVRGLTKQDPEGAIGHRGAVFALATSSSGKYLCSGGMDKFVNVWNPETLERLKAFSGHRGPVTGLAFQYNTLELFSISHDRSVKVWNLQEMGYVESMFGHEDKVADIDCSSRERPLTCGGRDRSLRVWKVADESQLVFRAHAACGSIECCRMINEEHFISGADDGSLSLWSSLKKKPIVIYAAAHQLKIAPPPRASDDESDEVPNLDEKDAAVKTESCWITAVGALKYTDLVASGSHDGCVRLWKVAPNYRTLTLLHEIPIVGFVNCLAFTSDGRHLVCGVGQEHKAGRWWCEKEAKNSVVVIPLTKKPLAEKSA